MCSCYRSGSGRLPPDISGTLIIQVIISPISLVKAIEPPLEVNRMCLTDGFRRTYSLSELTTGHLQDAQNSLEYFLQNHQTHFLEKTEKRSTSGSRTYEFFVSDNDLTRPTGSEDQEFPLAEVTVISAAAGL